MVVRPVLLIAVALSCLTVPLAAQELPPAKATLPSQEPLPAKELMPVQATTPQVEMFVGWSARGLSVRALDWNVNDRVAFVVRELNFGFSDSGTRYSVLVGPRTRWRPQHRVIPFAQFLVGASRDSSLDPERLQILKLSTRFQAAIAAGVDIRLSRRFAWRVVQVESRSVLGDAAPLHRLIVSSGIVARFGAK